MPNRLRGQLKVNETKTKENKEMKLKILHVKAKGGPNEEFVRLGVLDDCNLVDYGIMDQTFDEAGKLSNKLRHSYLFPDKEVKKGERVILRTGVGDDRTDREKKPVVHRFYWGLETSVWNDDTDKVVLFAAEAIDSKEV